VSVPVVVSAKPTSGPGAGLQGVASTRWSPGTQAGGTTLEARLVNSSTGAILSVGTFNVTVLPGPATGVQRVQGDSQTATAATTIAMPVQAKAYDGYGNPVPGAIITWEIAAGGGTVGAGQSIMNVAADASGLATVPWTLGAAAVTNQLKAYVLVSGVPIGTQFTAFARAGGSSSMTTAQRVYSPQVGTVITPTVLITDSNGNPVANSAVTFTVKSGGGGLDGVSAVTALSDASGNARINWTVGPTVGSNTLQATAQGLQGNPISFVAIPYACDCWTAKAAMPTVRRDVGVGTVNGLIHTAGGSNNAISPYFSTVEVYDPATDTWSSRQSMPTAYAFPTGGVIGGLWYLASGFGPPALMTLVQAYDPALNSWSSRASIPTGRIEAASSVVNNAMYVIGGDNTGNGTPTAVNEVYDPVTDQWAARAPLPQARFLAAGAVVNGRIYVVGGKVTQGGSASVARVDVYDPVANSWTTVSPMPTARQGPMVESVNGLLYVIGGHSPNKLGTVEVYDPATDVWVTRTQMPTPRGRAASSVINGRIYLIGGRDNTGAESFGNNEMYQP
ncbi:MAG: hypothetical protein OEY20_16520, partial [Gemmatimonadota bacterium]|nr:hypothetical protein [Gemmatimonadota bacterium]